jgi:hypothetical protein
MNNGGCVVCQTGDGWGLPCQECSNTTKWTVSFMNKLREKIMGGNHKVKFYITILLIIKRFAMYYLK